jgi:hypothetical protein
VSKIFSNRVCATSLGPGVPFPVALFVPANAACKSPFVWRGAREDDFACVSARSRRIIAAENRTPQKYAHQGDTSRCRTGFVRREAFEGDAVCVSAARQRQVRQENRFAPGRRLGG